MYQLKQKLQQPVYLAGLVCTAFSLFIFGIPVLFNSSEDPGSGLFVINYAVAITYFFVLVFSKNSVAKENKIHNTFLFLILSFISAWSLNREMSVFEDSAQWFAALLLFLCANYMGFAFWNNLSSGVKQIMSFIAGVSFVTFVYLSLYLMPLYLFGIIGFLLLGISLHVFVPLLFTIYTLTLMSRVIENNKKYWRGFLTGIIAVIAFVASYVGLWAQSKKQLDKVLIESNNNKDGFPAWVNMMQKMPDNFFTRKMLKTDLVYSVPQLVTNNLLWIEPALNFGEKKKHDPLVTTAIFLVGKPDIENEDKVRVLESIYEMRHESEERLWSGNHLFTEHVDTDVQLWAACNMAYTEKTITVRNAEEKRSWNRQEEAIYTFYLPEGGVVTALSLWINGKEEHGIMTTKEKADSAYKAIVGVEKRDPSVVHWQEGNTVSVRVFPVFAGESRKFKIGITAPLARVNGKLQYENVWFKGPSFADAMENVVFDFEQPVNDFKLPASFVSMSDQSYKREGKYESTWNMQINDPGLSGCSFSFDNNTYSLAPYHKKLSASPVDALYLDINKAWSKDEFNKIIKLADGKNIFVYDSELVKLDAGNKNEWWNKLHNRQFSLFPIFEINDPARSLLITKNTGQSPNIDDLAETRFMQQTKEFLRRETKLKLFDLGKELSPYLKSLKEFRVFRYDKGDVKLLGDLLTKEHFADDIENDAQVIIHKSDMIIQRTAGSKESSGPDHLMRLFSYNHIMQILGRGLLINRPPDNSIAEEARKAYVVTPVSSLVVLETKQDYERFDIKDVNTSLKNASIQSKGAVPEPHEWALIIIAFLTLGFIMKKKKLRYS